MYETAEVKIKNAFHVLSQESQGKNTLYMILHFSYILYLNFQHIFVFPKI